MYLWHGRGVPILTGMSVDELADRYRKVMDRVAAAASRSGRRPEQVVTVAVTKTAGLEQIRKLVELGHRDLGENRVQHLQQRAAMLQEYLSRRAMMQGRPAEADAVRWHMIGHLQRNKVRTVLPLVRLVHSVDSLRLAEEIQDEAVRLDRDVDVLIQVNVAGEAGKFGVPIAAAQPLAEQVQTMVHVRVRGIMTIAPQSDDAESSRPIFQRCAELFHEMVASGLCGEAFDVLSMGMSDDYEVAIECGANVVRIGRAIFGEPVLAE